MRLGDIMRGFVLGTVTAVALVAGGALAMQVSRGASYDQNTLHPERVIIGLDLSKSNPLSTIRPLPPGSASASPSS